MPLVLSFICNAVLYAAIAYEYVKTCKKGKNTYYNIVLGVLVILLMAFYVYSIHVRRMIYTWDFANYYRIQLRYRDYFDGTVISGIKATAASLLLDDYNCFISIFCEMYCRLFNIKSVNGYIMSYFVACIIPVIAAFSIMIRSFMNRFCNKTEVRKRAFYVIIMAAFVSMPLVNYSALLGQPDIFGLVFIVLLTNEALSYDFTSLDIMRCIVIFGFTIALILTRRWYMYWVVSFFVIWFVTLAFVSDDRKKALKNMAAFAAISLVAGGAALFVMFRRILTYNYGDRYSFYNIGGIRYEISNQISYLGIALTFLLGAAVIAGLAVRRLRAVTAGAVLSVAMCMLMITRVQNSAEHQSLIYVMSYMILIMVLLCVCMNADMYTAGRTGMLPGAVEMVAVAAVAAVMAVNSVVSVSGMASGTQFRDTSNAASGFTKSQIRLFTTIDTKPVVRDDWADIGTVYDYLTELISGGENIYIVPHGRKYNPDTFRNYKAPATLDDYIPYGACVTGTHIFPVEFLTYDYIMTCSPIDDLDTADNTIVKNLNEAVKHLAMTGVLEQSREFEFANGYVFTIYRRISAADAAEIDYLKDLFSYQSQKYPEDFEGVLEAYEKNFIRK